MPSTNLTLPSNRLGHGLVQRKPHCACGGSCPRCQDDHVKISEPHDKHELQADRVANQVVESTPRRALHLNGRGTTASYIPNNLSQDLGTGYPLDASARTFFESRLGYDFSHVRIHTDSKAADSARALDALAYTVGRDIVFWPAQYAPSSRSGQKLLAHELVHTIQQADGNMDSGGNILRLQRAAMDGLEEDDKEPDEGDESDCSGWMRDPQSLAIAATQHYRRTQLGLQTGSAETVTPSTGTAWVVTYSDKIEILADWIGVGRPFCSLDPGPHVEVQQIKPKKGKDCCYPMTCPKSGGIIFGPC